MLFPHFPKRLVSSSLIVLHVNIPGVGELYELVSLNMLNFSKLHTLPLLSLSHLFLQLNFGESFEFNPRLFRFQVLLLYLKLLVIISQYPHEGSYFEIR